MFQVSVIAVPPGASASRGVRLGSIFVPGEDPEVARLKAREELWDTRLDASGCSAAFETSPIPRYLVAEGWGHFFAGVEKSVRFVFDRETRTIVAMELYRVGWRPTTDAQRADVLDSLLNANEVALFFPSDYGLDEVDELPEWAASTETI